MGAFAGFKSAEIYDEFCNNTNAKERMKNISMFGNMQMIVARAGNILKTKNPELNAEEIVERLIDIGSRIEKNVSQILKNKGCESEEAILMKKSYLFYSKTHPGAFFNSLDKEIIKQGGSITPLYEE